MLHDHKSNNFTVRTAIAELFAKVLRAYAWAAGVAWLSGMIARSVVMDMV